MIYNSILGVLICGTLAGSVVVCLNCLREMREIAELLDWRPVSESLPVEGDIIDWITADGDIVLGGTKGPGRLWFLPDCQAYCVYCKPVAWRYSQVKREAK